MPQLKLTLQRATSCPTPARSQYLRWVRAALNVDTEVTIRIVDEMEGRTLNREYRGKDYATNVLTFPLAEAPHLIGDIVLCAPVIEKEAAKQAKDLAAHYAHLTVHGILHLQGYDHENAHQAELMEALEVTILAKLGYANPYVHNGDAA